MLAGVDAVFLKGFLDRVGGLAFAFEVFGKVFLGVLVIQFFR